MDGKPYSQDLRERVIKAIDDGHTRGEVAMLFDIGIATVGRYVKRQRRTGSRTTLVATSDTDWLITSKK